MNDTRTLRDHGHHCDHGLSQSCDQYRTDLDLGPGVKVRCPGGREVVFEFFGRDGTDPDGQILWVEATDE